MSEKLGMERNEDGFERLECLSEKEEVHSDLGAPFQVVGHQKERVFDERTLRMAGNRVMGQNQIVGYQTGSEDKNMARLKHPRGNLFGQEDKERNMNRFGSVRSSRGKGIEKISPQLKGSIGSRAVAGRWGLNRDGSQEPYQNFRMGDDRNIFSNYALYPDEGPSGFNCMKSSSRGFGELKDFDALDGVYRFSRLEQDRAELLRKLDEIKEQIYRGDSVAAEQRVLDAVDVKAAPGIYSRDRVPYKFPGNLLTPNKHIPQPHFSRRNGYGHVKDMKNLYIHPVHEANQFPVYKDPAHLPMPMSGSYQPPDQYFQQPLYGHQLAADMDFGRDHSRGTACSCFHCYSKKQHVPSQVPILCHKHFVGEPSDSNCTHHVNPIKYRPQSRTFQVNRHAKYSEDLESHAGWTIDIDSDVDAIRRSDRKRVPVAQGNVHTCHPFAGGAPFMACSSCFELLKLPRKLNATEQNQRKVRCSACLTVLLVEINNKKLIVSIPVENKQLVAETNDEICEVSKEVHLSPEGDRGTEVTKCSVDSRETVITEDQMMESNESNTRHDITYQSFLSSEQRNIPDSMIVHRDASDFLELPSKENASPTFPSSRSPEHLDDTSSNRKTMRKGEGNGTDKEKVVLDKRACQQNTANDVSSETEVEVSFNEGLNTITSQDSLELPKKECPPTIGKGSESFLVGLLRKSIRDFSGSNQHKAVDKPNVTVNGQPIPDSAVKKAERLAGPIHPGDYWYDSQAGFWGVMGQRCLGIIPPRIKEFSYPMSENCSFGNTSIFVNGRELHQKDLGLLASRGLPTTKEKSYIIEISGRVLEKDSGEELRSLGKLAPTVEKMKRGFGMKVPKSLVLSAA